MKILRPDEVQQFPDVRELSSEELAQAYALSRETFTAADLQQYTEEWRGVPMEDVLTELEARQKRLERPAS
jgi:hypothetical protein